MKVAYEPANLAGTEAYLVAAGVADAENVRAWIEEKALDAFGRSYSGGEEFSLLCRGVGFFHDFSTYTTAPVFDRRFDKDMVPRHLHDQIISLTFWIAADSAAAA